MNARGRRRHAVITPVQRQARSSASAWWPALLVVACVLTYWNGLSVPFVLDDVGTLANDSQIQAWRTVRGLLSPTSASAVAGRPVVQLSLALNDALGGRDVRGFHAWNLAIHAACALLLYGLVRRTCERLGMESSVPGRPAAWAFAAAVIWVVHPLNSEVVNYIVQRTESMMALCYLATLYASLRAIDAPRPTRWQALATGACAIGMACKESMVTAPLMVVLYDRAFVFPSFSRAFLARRRFYAALATTWVVLAAVVGSAPRSDSAGFSTGVAPWTYLLNQTVMITRYLELTVWPRSLVAFYGWPLSLTIGDVILPAAFLGLLLVLTVVAVFRWPRFGFLGAWFFITLAPASSIVPVATEVGAERRMYLPLMALVILGMLGIARLWDMVCGRWLSVRGARNSRWAFGAVVSVVALALAARTVERNREYQSELSLARTIVARWPTSIAHQILGEQLLAAGERTEGTSELQAAVRGDSMARLPLGLELFNQGRLNDSVEQLDVFVRTWRLPYRLVPHWLEPSAREVVQARTTMARAFTQLKQWPAVVEQCQLVLAINQSNADAQGMLADALYAEGRFAEAAMAYRRYAALRPADPTPFTQLGVMAIADNKPEEALVAFRRAVEVAPTSWQAQRNLANLLFDSHDAAAAATHAREAARLKPDDAAAHDLLGRSLGALGRLDEAAAEIGRALQLDPSDSQAREDAKEIARLKNRTAAISSRLVR